MAFVTFTSGDAGSSPAKGIFFCMWCHNIDRCCTAMAAEEPGVSVSEELGRGAHGTVQKGRLLHCGDNIPSWALPPTNVAVKQWERSANGIWYGQQSIEVIDNLGDTLARLVKDDLVVPVMVLTRQPPSLIMPIGVLVKNSDWPHVVALVDAISRHPDHVVHLDVKAANMVWHNGIVKFIDHEALCVGGETASGLPSYAPWSWDRWTNVDDFKDTDDQYFSTYEDIITTLEQDRPSALATMIYGGLATAITMVTGDGDPDVNSAAVENLGWESATRLYARGKQLWDDSAPKVKADALGASRFL